MNGITMQKATEVMQLTSIMASPIECWRDQWLRNGKLQMMSHPHTSVNHLVSKTIREMRNVERTLRMDLWGKVQRHYPRISLDSFRETFNALMNQAYYGLREDLLFYAQERENK